MAEKTKIQSAALSFPVGMSGGVHFQELATAKTSTYAELRAARAYPTIAIARELSLAPILAASESIEADKAPAGAAEFIEEQYEKHRDTFVDTTLRGLLDFGWAPHELVLGITDEDQVGLSKAKPLLHDITTIMLDQQGNLAGYKQPNMIKPLLRPNAFHVAVGVEGINYYGISRLENATKIYDMWKLSNDGAQRYDKKIAGALFVIRYPPGNTLVSGVETDNYVIAKTMLSALESLGSLVIPQLTVDYFKDLGAEVKNLLGWQIDLIADKSSRQATFVPRLTYLDALMARAMMWPERAFQEGNFGTKAEAGKHADMGLTTLELTHRLIVQAYNEQLVDLLMAVNYGPKTVGSVWIAPVPLVDSKLELFRSVYDKLLSNPSAILDELDNLDLVQLREALDLPVRDPKDVEADQLAAEKVIDDEPDEVDPNDPAALALAEANAST